MAVCAAAKFLMLKYGIKRNPWGYALFAAGIMLLVANWILYLIDCLNGNIMSLQWGYVRCWRAMMGVYLSCSVCLESIYFRAGYTFVFQNNSAVISGIYGFLKGFVRPFFHGIYVLLKYVVVVVFLLCGGGDIGASFDRFAVPFLLQIWMLGLFVAAKKNRPTPCVWWELKVWRPIVENGWDVALLKYKTRNPESVPPVLQWIAIQEEDSGNDRGGNENITAQDTAAQKESKLFRQISRGLDI